jgi:hypothetical protein
MDTPPRSSREARKATDAIRGFIILDREFGVDETEWRFMVTHTATDANELRWMMPPEVNRECT